MVFPPYAAPFPDVTSAPVTLGSQQRALLTAMAQRPGHVFTSEELVTRLNLPFLTRRRADTLMAGINDVLGEETVTEVPRRGWRLTWYEDTPSTISL